MYSNSNKEFTIEEGCPWYKEQQKYGPPNVNWCEPTQCSIINEPANAWTNVTFFLIGALILRKISSLQDKVLKEFAWAVIVMGLFSFTYHASNNYFSQFFDFLGMYLVTSFPMAIQIKRIKSENPQEYYSWFWFLMFLQTCLFWFFSFWGIAVQQTILLPVVFILLLEFWATRVEKKKFFQWNAFFQCLIFLVIAQTASQLDLRRIYCEPDNLFFHGHAIWHILSGIGMYFLARHLKETTSK
jgi:hypothetical protein